MRQTNAGLAHRSTGNRRTPQKTQQVTLIVKHLLLSLEAELGPIDTHVAEVVDVTEVEFRQNSRRDRSARGCCSRSEEVERRKPIKNHANHHQAKPTGPVENLLAKHAQT